MYPFLPSGNILGSDHTLDGLFITKIQNNPNQPKLDSGRAPCFFAFRKWKRLAAEPHSTALQTSIQPVIDLEED